MDERKSKVILFIDDEPQPVAELDTPVVFELDTTKLTDGEHLLRIVSQSPEGGEGLRKIKFTVKNGPAISVAGLKNNDVVDGTLSLMINSYNVGSKQGFIIKGSETPNTVPTWLWVIIILFSIWGAYYTIRYITM
ncbi:MAG: cytochrome C [Chryseobacterium sp.]|nr:MAG: cytochrome C [Chryseobacterium sp.]